ncbi:ubinuclein-1 isoform X1 [Physcomitrium patens]|uniref:Hpc2-related domain-containing protein n=1 Tax=Physcomitrium patens TaxID=3218 RepID=A0A7I4DGW4_PHYPA|nr:ubinuclein-1-like isoform X1 [Physcomitrium patens]|eukprot:XP_024371711.1 ubinuclein-1-like isoform X1 [Physcomitrella patens]
MPSRQRFFVELKDEETTVVSWKKLVSDAEGKLGSAKLPDAPAGANPALEARIAPEIGAGSVAGNEDPLPQVPNRFSSVIERIERLYKGGDSDDDGAEDSPDEDQYDTDDPFIDDEELNEYFMVEEAKTKHTGFFINRGALEKINVPTPSPAVLPKKRRRREPKKDKKDEKEVKRRMKGRIKVAARQYPLHSENFAVGDPQISREHNLSRIQSSDPEEISSDSDAFLRGPSRVSYKQEKQDFAEVDNNGGTVERPLEATVTLNTETVFGGGRNAQSKVEYKYDEKKWKEAAREPKGVMKVSESLKMKMMQQSVKEDGPRDSDGGGGQAVAGFTKSLSPGPIEPSPGRRGWPKGTVMERAIQDLIKMVALLCPQSAEGEVQEAPSQPGAKAKRLPREVKTRLAKVARLAQAKQGKVPDELVVRLHGILGHIMRPNTLKRNLKEMVEHGLSAKQEKEGRLLDIKREVTEMVRNQVTKFKGAEAREGSSDDFQAGPLSVEKAGTSTEKYKWDHAMEDLLCNLYDQYLEGMDEHKGPQIRKLYFELAELWPEGWMDNNGIKAAVLRAKERQKRLNKLNKGPRKRKTGSSSDVLRTEDDFRDGSGGSLINHTNQSFGVPLPKRSDDSTPEEDSIYLSGSRAWLSDEKIGKYKQHFEGSVRSSLKMSQFDYKEKAREGSKFMGHGIEKNILMKKRRKRMKAGTEIDLTASRMVFQKSLSIRDYADTVSHIPNNNSGVYDGLIDEELFRSINRSTKSAPLEPEKP